MPSSIFFNGSQRFRPNVYAKVLVSEGPTQASTGAVAIVGDFPELKPNTPKTFTTKLEQNAYFLGSNQTLDLLGDLAYRPTAGLDASIQSLTFVNANQSTQANHDFGSVLVQSKLYGPYGNRLKAKVQESNGLYNLSVQVGAETLESITGLGDGAIATIGYTATNTFGEMLVDIDATDFTVTGKISKAQGDVTGGANMVATASVASGNVTLASDANQADSDSVFTITGLGLDGTNITETATMTTGTQQVISVNSFSRIDSIVGDANFDGALTITFPVYTKALSEISDFGAELDNLVNLNADIAGTFAVSKPVRKTTGLELDELTAQNAWGATVNFTKNAKSVSDWFNQSQYVEATLQTRGAITSSGDPVRLTNGTRATSVSEGNYQSALDSLKIKPVNIVVPFTDEIDVHKLARTHATASVYERNIWVGSTPNQTIESVASGFSGVLNDKNVAVVCQSIKLANGNTYDPKYLAFVLACMQGATPVGTPLTRKETTPLITETAQNFVVEDKASYAIQNGIVLLTNPRGTGLNVERSVTSYQVDDNKVFSEVSANESLNIAVRTVRGDLQALIGTAITSGKQNDVRRVVSSTLRDLMKVGFILSFKDVNVSLSGDTAEVSFEIAVTEPLNFIVATINVG